MTRKKFAINQIKDYAVIDSKIYNLDKSIYKKQRKIKYSVYLCFLVLVIVVYKLISVCSDKKYALDFAVIMSLLSGFVYYITAILALPKNIDEFIISEKEEDKNE